LPLRDWLILSRFDGSWIHDYYLRIAYRPRHRYAYVTTRITPDGGDYRDLAEPPTIPGMADHATDLERP